MIAESPNNWQAVRRKNMVDMRVERGDPTYLNQIVYVNRITGRVINEQQYQEILTRWEIPVVVVEEQEKKRARDS